MTVQTTLTALRDHPLDALRRAVLRLLEVISETSTVMACARHAEYLNSLSDAELAARGLKRDRIMQHAFARYMAF